MLCWVKWQIKDLSSLIPLFEGIGSSDFNKLEFITEFLLMWHNFFHLTFLFKHATLAS